MKILQVTNFFKPSWESGGPARVVYGLSKKLMERGHEVTVYTTDGFKCRLDIEKNKPVNVDGIRTYYFRNLSSYLAREMVLPIPYYLPMVARKEIIDFDVIHIHENRTLLAAVIHHYAKKYRVRYILQSHGSVLPTFQKQRLKKIYDIFFGCKILKEASKVIALTVAEAEQYKKMGVDEDKIEIVPNGIDLSVYENLPKKGEFRGKYSISDDEKIILYLGRLHKIKGIDILVKAFADVSKELNNVKLVIVGPDDGFLPPLKKQIDDLNIGDKILFTGPLYERDKLEAYVDADVYVLPSVYEIFSVTVLEACACGTPVIVTDRCGIADFVDGRAGCVVGYDKDQLRDAIIKVLSNERLRRRFGETGKRLVNKEFGWDKIVGGLEQIYADIIREQHES
jgi:glycosyltransferase involved in cell wall biosynthesis